MYIGINFIQYQFSPTEKNALSGKLNNSEEMMTKLEKLVENEKVLKVQAVNKLAQVRTVEGDECVTLPVRLCLVSPPQEAARTMSLSDKIGRFVNSRGSSKQRETKTMQWL